LEFLGLNILLLSLVFSYLSAFEYSMAVLAPAGSDVTSNLRRMFGLTEDRQGKPGESSVNLPADDQDESI
jgi:hypothetical protein